MLKDNKVRKRNTAGNLFRYLLRKYPAGINKRTLNIQFEFKSKTAFQEFSSTNQNVGGVPRHSHHLSVKAKITFIEAASKRN